MVVTASGMDVAELGGACYPHVTQSETASYRAQQLCLLPLSIFPATAPNATGATGSHHCWTTTTSDAEAKGHQSPSLK
ncbi:Hypothetical predicted protein [Olea europaea subsp. europaea]|uniref:Uncharacterized protein n=1 Tax=Olea europaea subsp. europaea TaxID=158383 RepID=A0A8S0QE40_OLEEU|nr:Hypothetical predicted protein [Olea europaea subsp. europaea]